MAKSKAEAASSSTNKTQMVAQALQELGTGAQPKEIQSHVLEKHGVELSTTMISSYKSNILKKQGGAGRRGGGAAGAGGSVGLKDLATLRDLVDRVGAAELQQLIKVLDR